MHTLPSTKTYIALLRACSKSKTLQHAKQVHAHLALHRTHMTGLLADYLVMTLAKCGAVDDAYQIATTLPIRTVFSWTAIISAYAECGHGHKALKMHQCMQEDGVEPSNYTFVSLFKACGSILDLEQGKKLHADARTKGFAWDVFVCSALLNMYGKCGAVVEAENAFCTLVQRDIVSWNTMLSAYVKQHQAEKALQLYRQMQEEGLTPDHLTFVIALQACGTLAEKGEASFLKGRSVKLICFEIGQGLHVDAHRKTGCTSHILVGNTLVSMYGKCGAIVEAQGVFSELSHCGVISWNAMLSAYVGQGQALKGLQLYTQMQKEGMSSNQLTFLISLQACGMLAEKEETFVVKGRLTKKMCLGITQALHTDVCLRDYESDVLIGTALLSIYGKCGSIVEAEDVFCALSHRDVVAWTAMLSTYLEQGQGEKALQLYGQMQDEGMSPNQLTFVIAFQACGILAEKEEAFVVKGRLIRVMPLEIGQALHVDACLKGYTSNILVGTAIVNMYGKCGTIVEAEDVFGALSYRDIVSWNTMLSAYVVQGQGEKALWLYTEMQKQLVTVDDGTLVCLMQACSEAGSLEICRQLHFNIISAGYDQIHSVEATLIHAYGTSGSMVDAQACFDELSEPDIVSWTTCISGHAGQGDSVASLHMFEKMKLASNKPDDVVLTLVLTGCSHAGLVVEGVEYFDLMNRDYGIAATLKHYGIMIDLFGRAGDFKRIQSMLVRMPMQADLTIWLCLLGACHTHGNLEMAKQAFHHAVNMQPKEGTAYVLMSNIYANAGLQEFAAAVEQSRHKQGAWRNAWTELD